MLYRIYSQQRKKAAAGNEASYAVMNDPMNVFYSFSTLQHRLGSEYFFYKWVHLKLTSSLRTYLACSVTSTEWGRICYPFGLIWTNCWLAFYEIIVCNPLSGLRRLINYKIARLASSMSFINHADTFWSSLNVEVWKKARMSLDDPSSTFQTDLRPHILCHSA